MRASPLAHAGFCESRKFKFAIRYRPSVSSKPQGLCGRIIESIGMFFIFLPQMNTDGRRWGGLSDNLLNIMSILSEFTGFSYFVLNRRYTRVVACLFFLTTGDTEKHRGNANTEDVCPQITRMNTN